MSSSVSAERAYLHCDFNMTLPYAGRSLKRSDGPWLLGLLWPEGSRPFLRAADWYTPAVWAAASAMTSLGDCGDAYSRLLPRCHWMCHRRAAAASARRSSSAGFIGCDPSLSSRSNIQPDRRQPVASGDLSRAAGRQAADRGASPSAAFVARCRRDAAPLVKTAWLQQPKRDIPVSAALRCTAPSCPPLRRPNRRRIP
jgi:hypothetical protein